jgi:hypothetical protein
MKLPIEIMSHILSYRPIHDIAKMVKEKMKHYHSDTVEYPSHTRTVIHGRTGKPYLKQYYDVKPCAEFMTFSQYCLNKDDYEIYPDYE